MLVPNQKVIIKWNNSNKKWFESLGYTGYQRGKEFEIPIEHLIHSSKIHVRIICDLGNEEYSAPYASYCKQMNKWNMSLCTSCAFKYAGELTRKRKAAELWPKLETMCKKWGYILVTKQDDYVDAHMKIQYICPKHGLQSVDIYNFLKGCQCFFCSYEHRVDSIKYSQDEVKNIIESVYNNKWLNYGEYITVKEPNLIIGCGSCDYKHTFTVSLANYMKHNINRCQSCTRHESLGEIFIRLYLEADNIKFYQQHRFKDCRDKKPLPFDFYLIDYNICIEFDGEGHYWPTHGLKSFLKTKKHDEMKTQYCIDNNIILIRIPYWERDNKTIKQFLDNELKKYKQKI